MSTAIPKFPTPGPSDGGNDSTVSNRWVTVAGFVVAGAALLLLADVQPQFAIGTAALIGLGVALSHTNEINSLVATWRKAVGA